MDWKFWIADIGIPVITFIIGIITGKNWDKFTKISAKSKIKGNNNSVTQNSKIKR